MHWVDQNQLCAVGFGIHENGYGVRAGSEDILSPQKDVFGIEQIEDVVTFFFTKVECLSGISGTRANIASLCCDGTELLEKVVREVLDQTQRPATSIVKYRCGSRLFTNGR